MKRSELRRKTAIRASGGQQRPSEPRKALGRGKPLRRARPRQIDPEEQAALDRFRSETLTLVDRHGRAKRRKCACGCGERADDPHHALELNYLKHRFPGRPDVWHDPRHGVPLARRCHEGHTLASRRLPRERLPAAVFDFAREHGLMDRLTRTYPEEDKP